MFRNLTTITAVVIWGLSLSGNVAAQDPGIRDTLEIMPRTISIGISTPVAVRIVNDSMVQSFEMQMIAETLDSGFARIDSITFGGRMSDPSVLGQRIVNLIVSDGISPDKFLCFAQRFTANKLPAGNDTLVMLYFTGIKPGRFSIDTTFISGAGGINFIQNSSARLYQPVIKSPAFEVVAGGLPPVITVGGTVPIVTNGTNNLSMNISASSPTGIPVSLSLASFTDFDDTSRTPSSMPILSGSNPALLNWTPGLSDIGIWLATLRAIDSAGLTSTASARIQVVSDESFLVSFNVLTADSAVQGTSISHGNLDNDPFPELFMPSAATLLGGTFGVYDFDQSSLTETYRVSNGHPARGGMLGFLNSDNDLDAVICQRGVPVILPGSKVGNFSSPVVPTTPGEGICVGTSFADINGDEYLDYVTAKFGKSFVEIYLGSSAGLMLDQQIVTQDLALSVNSADFDGDGRDDLAIGTEAGLEIHLNRGVAGFILAATYSQVFGSIDIEVTNQGSDFNNDNLFDLALATPSVGGAESELMLYEGIGDGTFNQSRIRLVKGQIFANCAGDFNNDGELDIAYLNGSLKYVAIAFGDGTGGFPEELRFDIPAYTPFQLDCLDIDLDGDLDLVVSSYNIGIASSLFLFRNNSNPSGVSQSTLEIMAQNNASIDLRSPSGRRLNKVVTSMSSGAYYPRSLDNNTIMDATALTRTIESGSYSLTVGPKQNLAINDPFSLEYLIDGLKFRLANNIPMPAGGVQYTIYPDRNSPISPRAGAFVNDPQPVFMWPGNGNELFELATDIDFASIVISDTATDGFYSSTAPLPMADSTQYFWRITDLQSGIAGETFVFNSVDAVTACCVGTTGNVDGDAWEQVDVTDLTLLIDYLFINFPALPCAEEANIDGDSAGNIDITDLTVLIDHLFISFPPTAACQ